MLHTKTFELSAFADEISPNLLEQTETLQRLQVKGLDLRSVEGVNILDLSDGDLLKVSEACMATDTWVQTIGSPVNKVTFSLENEAAEWIRLKKAIHAAQELDVARIRIFTPEVPVGQEEALAPMVISWMANQRKLAEDEGVVLLIENDARYWNAYPENSKRLFGELGNESFRAAFDFANTVLIGFRPMEHWFPWILPYLDTLHIKDAIEAEHRVVPAGEGDGQLQETLKWLIDQGWHGPLTLEPHLSAAGKFGGFSGVELFEVATAALRKILTNLGVHSS